MKIACYARKSNNLKNESIENQFSIIEKHIAAQADLSGADILHYSDEGESGISTKRDKFQELLSKVREREIDVIVVKDLSRLGRNYLDVIKLVDSIFPFMGVRIIAVSDGYDSKYKSNTVIDLPLAFTAILNEFHVTELSDKSRKSFAHRIKNGALYGDLSFGYYYGKNREVLIDNKKAEIVRNVFKMFVAGKSTLDIARNLNECGIQTNRGKQWLAIGVLRMLTNTDYIGIKRFFTSVKDLKTKRRTPAKEENVFVNENSLPPIIDSSLFEKARAMIKTRENPYVPEYHVMARKLYCAHCKRTLRRNKNFSCASSSLTGAKSCFQGTLKRDVLYPAVLKEIKAYIGKEINHTKRRYSFSDKKKLENALSGLLEQRAQIYEKFMDGKIEQSEFNQLKTNVNEKIVQQNKSIDEWRKQQALVTKTLAKESPIALLKRLYNTEELTKEHMQFVKIINVYDVNHYVIILHEESPLTVLCRNISIYEEV
jgi:DNA invertase Pin-like site-specific DNA recombinase